MYYETNNVGMHACEKEEFETKFPDVNSTLFQLYTCLDSLKDIELYGGEK